MLFMGEMVRALLADRKTQTRRLEERDIKVGDRIWVRETWRSWHRSCVHDIDYRHRHDEHCEQTYVAYRATPRIGFRPIPDQARIVYLDESTPLESNRELLGPWKPGIHMFRWACRLVLKVTEVRKQRLQDITEDDAKAEGVERDTYPCDHTRLSCEDIGCLGPTHRATFAELWDRVNGERAPWASNPPVRAYTFRRVP